jgi:chemotaxis protein MotB
MPRRIPPDDYVNTDRWILSYADFITLLFAFFVVMYSLSSVNEEKYKELSNALSGAFEGAGLDASILGTGQGAIIGLGEEPAMPKEQVEPTPELELPDADETDQLKTIMERLETRIRPNVSERDLKLVGDELWLSIELRSGMLFSSGQARPTREADELLQRLAVILRPYDNPIHVEGFTDDQVIDTDQFPSNWELSAARAAAVVRLLNHHGVDPARMAAVGYGEFQPAYSNRTDEGRQLNRRVVIVVSRDEKVRRTLSAFGSQQVSKDAVSTVIATDQTESTGTPVIEQVETASGGKLFRQVAPVNASDQQENE